MTFTGILGFLLPVPHQNILSFLNLLIPTVCLMNRFVNNTFFQVPIEICLARRILLESSLRFFFNSLLLSCNFTGPLYTRAFFRLHYVIA